MNRFFDSITAFVQRNPIFCLVFVMLALLAPQVLQGIFLLFLYGLLALFLFLGVAVLLFRWRIARLKRQMEEQSRNGGGFPNGSGWYDAEGRSQNGGWYGTGGGGTGGPRFGADGGPQRGRGAYGAGPEQSRRHDPDEGTVRIHRTADAPQKRVSDSVGDYVDFEESHGQRNNP